MKDMKTTTAWAMPAVLRDLRRENSGLRHRLGWQAIVNAYIFANVAAWVGWSTWHSWTAGELGFVESAFTLQSLIMLTLFLVRRRHAGLDGNWLHQAVAAIAFFSGIAFIGQPATAAGRVALTAKGVTLAANLLSAVALLNLGRSFGVLIARRPLKTRGLYAVVRHPMYASDILLRVGFAIGHCTPVTITLLIASSACYVYRALLEERFLAEQESYRDYRRRVRYRLVPFVF